MNQLSHTLRLIVLFALFSFIAGVAFGHYVWNTSDQVVDEPHPTVQYTLVSNSTIHQPYTWTVTRVLDGDTVEVNAKFFPPELGNIQVRVRGIDTPESGGHAKCKREAELAALAKAKARELLLGQKIIVSNIIQDKYGGRLVGVVTLNGRLYSDIMIEQHLAVPYLGKTKQSWC